jgi:hypothetical protein
MFISFPIEPAVLAACVRLNNTQVARTFRSQSGASQLFLFIDGVKRHISSA